LVVVPFARRLLPPGEKSSGTTRLDLIGLILIGLGTATFMAPFVTTPDTGFFHDSSRWFWLIPAVVLLPVTFFWERRYQHRYHAAVLSPGLLRNPSFVYGAILGSAYFAGFTALMLVLSMMFQSGLGHSALLTGLVQLPYAVASGVVSAQSGKLVPNLGRRLVVIGLATTLIGLLVVISVIRFSPENAIVWALCVALFVMGAGNGSVISPNQALTFQDVPVEYGSVAGAVLQVGQRAGSAVGMAVVLAVYLSTFTSQIGTVGSVEAARVAASSSLLISSIFIGLALIVSILDLRRRTH